MTEIMYIQHPNLYELSTQIIKQGNVKRYVFGLRRLFHPQGGGQPADRGKIITSDNCYDVSDVRNDDEIGIILYNNAPIHIADPVTINVDQERRILNSKYHTAEHIAAVAKPIRVKSD